VCWTIEKWKYLKSLSVVTMATYALTGCEDHNWRDGLRGRSNHFVFRDVNRDDEITRAEWERYMGTLINDPNVVVFDKMDCNNDGIVNWSEYYSYRFKRQMCVNSVHPSSSESPELSFRSENRLYAPKFCVLGKSLRPIGTSHSEKPLSNVQFDAVIMTCTDINAETPPIFGRFNNQCSDSQNRVSRSDERFFSDISITNNNPDVIISMVTFRLETATRINGTPSKGAHIKTVSIEPNATMTIRTWFGEDTERVRINDTTKPLSCKLMSARGSRSPPL
jgi:hypothetical protein